MLGAKMWNGRMSEYVDQVVARQFTSWSRARFGRVGVLAVGVSGRGVRVEVCASIFLGWPPTTARPAVQFRRSIHAAKARPSMAWHPCQEKGSRASMPSIVRSGIHAEEKRKQHPCCVVRSAIHGELLGHPWPAIHGRKQGTGHPCPVVCRIHATRAIHGQHPASRIHAGPAQGPRPRLPASCFSHPRLPSPPF